MSSNAEEAGTDYIVDGVSNLSGVRQFSVDGETGRLIVTMPNKVVLMDTFPLQVVSEVNLYFTKKSPEGPKITPVEGISSAVNADDALVVLGEDAGETGGGGILLVYENISDWDDPNKESLNQSIGTTPYSQALLKDSTLYAVNPTLFSIMQVSVGKFLAIARGEEVTGGYSISEFLKLRCGSASKISIIDVDDEDGAPKRYFFASVTGKKELEMGRELVGKYAFTGSTCFKPGGSIRSKSGSLPVIGRQSLLHEVISNQWYGYDPEQPNKWVITFDPDDHMLTLFPIRFADGNILLRRSEGASMSLAQQFEETGLPRGQFGLMAASDGASVVLVSHIGSNFVHRLKRVEDRLEYLGYSRFSDPVRMLEVAENGSIAAVLTGDIRKDVPETLHLIKTPAAITGSGDIDPEWFSVMELQKVLGDRGLALKLDGIYGRETQSALNAYLSEVGVASATPDDDAQTKTSLTVDDRLRGLFPVENFGPLR